MSRFVKRQAVFIGVCVAICVVCALLVARWGEVKASHLHTVNAPVVVIDAGHGGVDNGVTGSVTGVTESSLNLLMAKQLREVFSAAGFKVVMTRKDANGLYGAAQRSLKRADMLARKKIICSSSPSIVISVHMNKFSSSERRGAQVFFSGDEASKKLAAAVQSRLNAMPEATRSFSALYGDYYVLKVSPCPAVLVECGFLSSPEDEALLINEKYRARLAYEIFVGTVEFLWG